MCGSLHFGYAQHWQLLGMQFILKQFQELTVSQLYEIYKLRNKVFVVEQNCPYEDVDEKDPESYHFMMLEGQTLAGYCRILPPGISYAEPAIGRVVVDPDFRGKNSGRLLMNNCIKQTFELFHNQEIVISAQTYLLKFYTELGFVPEGEEYPEDDIPHIKMRLKVR